MGEERASDRNQALGQIKPRPKDPLPPPWRRGTFDTASPDRPCNATLPEALGPLEFPRRCLARTSRRTTGGVADPSQNRAVPGGSHPFPPVKQVPNISLGRPPLSEVWPSVTLRGAQRPTGIQCMKPWSPLHGLGAPMGAGALTNHSYTSQLRL